MTKEPSANTDKPKLPQWVREPFIEFLKEAENLRSILRLSIMGISMVRDLPPLAEALMTSDQSSRTEAEEHELKEVKRDAELARNEVQTGFPRLHFYAIFDMWSLLESALKNFLVAWFRNEPSALEVTEVSRLRIRFGQYQQLTPDEQYEHLVFLFEQEVGASVRNGVNRFEAMLAPFGLSGEVEESTRRALFEFGQVRNLLAHRSGRVDQRFLDACPWFNIGLGEKLLISGAMLDEYFYATACYVTTVTNRLHLRFGLPPIDLPSKQ